MTSPQIAPQLCVCVCHYKTRSPQQRERKECTHTLKHMFIHVMFVHHPLIVSDCHLVSSVRWFQFCSLNFFSLLWSNWSSNVRPTFSHLFYSYCSASETSSRWWTDFCSTTSILGCALEGRLLQTIKLINGQSLLFWSLLSFASFTGCLSHDCTFN